MKNLATTAIKLFAIAASIRIGALYLAWISFLHSFNPLWTADQLVQGALENLLRNNIILKGALKAYLLFTPELRALVNGSASFLTIASIAAIALILIDALASFFTTDN